MFSDVTAVCGGKCNTCIDKYEGFDGEILLIGELVTRFEELG